MNHARLFCFVALGLLVGFFGCSKENAVDTPTQEYITKNLVPSKAETRAESFALAVEDLQVNMAVNPASKEIVETPTLRGRLKITNTSKDVLDVQGITLAYIDQQGKQIPFKSGEKTVKASLSLNALKPGEVSENSLDVTFPRAAVKGLGKIDINLVYIPSPLKRETVTLTEKVE